MSTHSKPLWTRVLKDKTARAWLKKHRAEFPETSFIPDDVAFKDKTSSAQEFIADILTELIPSLTGDDREIAKLYLKTHPSRIAEEMGWDRKDVYLAIRRLKRQALRKWSSKREKKTLRRNGKLDLDTSPELVALRTLRFSLHEIERRAFLVDRDGQRTWVDEAGKVFTKDVQEILNELPEHSPGFSVVDVEAEG